MNCGGSPVFQKLSDIVRRQVEGRQNKGKIRCGYAGEQGDFAIKQSAKQIQPARKVFAFPFLGLLVTSKLLGFAGRMALVNLDPRITAEIPEIPIAIYVLIAVATLIIHR